MTASVPPGCPPGGTDASHNFLLGGYCARLIENRLHWVRDETLGEDRCRVRTGEAPEILAGIRNAALWLMRASGLTHIVAALRRHAAKPLEALELVKNPTPS